MKIHDTNHFGVEFSAALCAEAHGFSLHAGVHCGVNQRNEFERLCRYITRAAIANEWPQCRSVTSSSGSKVLIRKSAKSERSESPPAMTAPRPKPPLIVVALCVGSATVS